jgi:cell division protein FtsL
VTAPRYTRLPRAAPRPEERRRPRPELHVVPEGQPRRRRTRLFTALAVLAAVVGLFAILSLHVILTQEQMTLDRLEAQADELEAQNQRLRVQVAELESPNRIVTEARRKFAMAPPTSIVAIGEAASPALEGRSGPASPALEGRSGPAVAP